VEFSSVFAGAYQGVWSAFCEAELTADGRHDSDYWRSHAGPFVLAIVRVPPSAFAPDLALLRRDLASIGAVRLHPDAFLHITLQELGFLVDSPAKPDEISAERLEEFAQAAVSPAAATPPFEVALAHVNSFQDAIFVETHDGDALARLHEQLFDLAAIPRTPAYPYLPHCTLAHYNQPAPVADAVAAIAPWRHAELGRLSVSEIEIVTLDPGEPYPPMKSYAVIPLGR
jgi:2'-5' RNA ligase